MDNLSDPDDLSLSGVRDLHYDRGSFFTQCAGDGNYGQHYFGNGVKDLDFCDSQLLPPHSNIAQAAGSPSDARGPQNEAKSREFQKSALRHSVPPPSANSQPRTASFDERFKSTIDYRNIMSTVVSLKEQKNQALTDIRKLEAEKARLLDDPQHFVQILFKKKDLIPPHQTVTPLPVVDFKCYENLVSLTAEPPKVGDAVRGRTYTLSKPMSFNLPWTYEEQKKLEQLLIEYPDEPVSAYRWEKIARALGNRTPKQVGSRVQKYFIRLAQAGLPVPGRVPNLQNYVKEKNLLTAVPKSSRAPHVHTKHINYYEPPAVRIDDESASFKHLKCAPEHKELAQLCREQEESVHEVYIEAPPRADNTRTIRCNLCGVDPIIGYIYRCQLCDGVQFCEKCHSGEIGIHEVNHPLEKSKKPNVEFIDPDYTTTNEMNYLDPHFLP